MKKYLILTSFILFNSICNAGYVKKSDLQKCKNENDPVYTIYLIPNACGSDCVKVRNDFSCKYHTEQDTQVDDFEKPIYSKNDIAVCSGQSDCEFKLVVKVCSDPAESKYIAADYSEIYCSKFTGYAKKTVLIVREDAAKKASYEAVKSALEAARLARRNDVRGNLKSKLEADTDLTNAELRKMLLHLLGD